MILILFVLPSDQNDWVDIDETELKIRRNAYWYIPTDNSDFTENEYRISVTIPKTNRLGIDCFNDLHQQLYK